MSTPKMTRAIQNLFKQISQMAHTLTKGLIRWLLRGLLMIGRGSIASKAGFVLPTTVLLLLVVTLTVGAISFRTYTRSQQAIGERQQRVVYNAATPAIDRAKAKLEFLFNGNRDRRAGGVLPEDQLLGMMLNDGTTNGVPRYPATGPDPYTFPGEKRIDINGDGKKDNAWVYETEQDANGRSNQIAYSIIFDAPNANQTALTLLDSTTTTLGNRARALLVRNAPLSNNTQTNPACVRNTGDDAGSSLLSEQGGWFEDQVDTTMLRKNFQVDAYVLPLVNGNPDPSSTIATLEFQQDREATQGFRWAAWFRNDIEVFPGPEFNWNGAMHTEGSYFFAGNFRSYMVSDPDSCLYKEDASRMSTPDVKADPSRNQPAYQGQFIEGELRGNTFGGSNRIDLWNGERTLPHRNKNLTQSTDSIVDNFSGTPTDFALDPVRLHTEDVSVSRGVANPSAQRASNWQLGANGEVASEFGTRLKNKDSKKPYLDDTFRADDRSGPKPSVGYGGTPLVGDIGVPIVGNLELTDTKEGLDGYWERRARTDGLRVIVGQRLELGNPAGWGGPTSSDDDNRRKVSRLDNEPLRPWPKASEGGCSGTRCNEARQRRTLADNLAAVQATVVYHKAKNEDYPAACMATTVHPGTAGTLDKSATFEDLAFGFETAFTTPYQNNGRVISDFFRGRGTNGWEYAMPDENDLRNPNSPLAKALHNLAYFAGDPLGGAPSFTPVQNTGTQGVFPHPFPSMAMWGDFSMLRRILGTNYTAATYNGLSIADRTAVHSAACMLGMLAYNIDYLNKFNPDAVPSTLLGSTTTTDFDGLRGHIRAIDAMVHDTANNNNDGSGAGVPASLRSDASTKAPDEIKRISAAAMDSMAWIKGTSGSEASNDPETYVRLLEFWRDAATDTAFKEQLTKEIALARMFITKEQVDRDRKYGFLGRYALDGEFLLSDRCNAWYQAAAATPAEVANSFREAARKEPLMRLCSDRPHYPILYSLFPLEQHGDVGDTNTVADTNGQVNKFMVRDKQDNGSAPLGRGDAPRNFNYLSGVSPAGNINKNVQYQVLTPANIAAMAAKPQKLGDLGFGASDNWTIPVQSVTAGTTPNGMVDGQEMYSLVKVCPASGTWDQVTCSRATNLTSNNNAGLVPVSGSRYRVPFKDAALMNGRELMSVRTLNLDLDLMRRTAIGSDYWLPKSGIIYAFREDAVSEAHIVRPTVQTWTNCGSTDKFLSDGTCQMNTTLSALDSRDPPLNPRKISPKPVDFYADPDRRPYGFRLRNGAALWRGSSSGSEINDNADPVGRGLSFISDNPVYIQGPFNLHRAANESSLDRANGLEEFTQKLNTADFNTTSGGVYGFYDRTNLEERFADRKQDQWRPAEVLGDAITLLSTNFCDGSIEDGFITAGGGSNNDLNSFVDVRYGCPTGSNNRTSYQNQNRVTQTITAVNDVRWMRSSIVDAYWRATLSNKGNSIRGRAESPVYILRNANPLTMGSGGLLEGYSGDSDAYAAMRPTSGKRDLMPAANGVQINTILISGLVPSRGGQSYGGLHNFPRFLEDWDNATRALFFSGAFLQLNFSTYATAPFDQEQWEPGLPAPVAGSGANEWLAYYGAPPRRWGFDVGLKYAPPGPVAERFRSPEPTRSEFYSEPPADDPYIELLEPCAQDPSSCGA